MHIENLSSSRRVSLSKQRFIQMIFVVGNGPVGGQYSNPSSRLAEKLERSSLSVKTQELTCKPQRWSVSSKSHPLFSTLTKPTFFRDVEPSTTIFPFHDLQNHLWIKTHNCQWCNLLKFDIQVRLALAFTLDPFLFAQSKQFGWSMIRTSPQWRIS